MAQFKNLTCLHTHYCRLNPPTCYGWYQYPDHFTTPDKDHFDTTGTDKIRIISKHRSQITTFFTDLGTRRQGTGVGFRGTPVPCLLVPRSDSQTLKGCDLRSVFPNDPYPGCSCCNGCESANFSYLKQS